MAEINFKRLEEEIGRAGEEINIEDYVVKGRLLQKIKLGNEVYEYNRPERTLRKLGERKALKLTGKDREMVDFIVESIRSLKKDLRDVSRIERMTSSRLQKLSPRELIELEKARTKLRRTGI
jgi:hypothetical protein